MPTLRMEVIADLDLRIWHLYFGLPGAMNDLNILSVSPHFSDVLSGKVPSWKISWKIGDKTFYWLYYLADGICPKYEIIVKSLSASSTRKKKTFFSVQEAVRKGIERVFGVLFK